MRWMIFGAMMGLVVGQADAAQLLVVESRGLDLKPGQAIDGAQPLRLAEGQQLTLIASSGVVFRLRGPVEQVPDAHASGGSAPGVAGVARTMLTSGTARTTSLGSIRGSVPQRASLPTGAVTDAVEPARPGAAQPWTLDASAAGDRCIRAGQPAFLTRSHATGEATVTLSSFDKTWRQSLKWAAGQDRLPLPADLPFAENSAYFAEIAQKGGGKTLITLFVVPERLGNDQVRAVWMLEKGCHTQAAALVRALP